MANRSTFPTTIDSFLEHYELSASDKPSVLRFQELKLKSSLTPSESDELATLTNTLRDKLITSEDFNKLQDAIVNLEVFFRDSVDGYITTKQNEVTATVNQGKTDIQATKDSALVSIEQKKENIITYMDSTTAGQIRNDIGVMGDLSTTEKSNLVGALNEVKSTSIPSSQKAQPNGIATLGSDGKVPTSQLNIDTSTLTSKTEFNTHLADYLTHTGYAVTTGAANAYVAALNPALSAYAEGVSLRLKINVANTGASTVNVNGLGAKSIKKSNGNDVVAGNLKVGVIYTLAYDGTSFILQGEGGDGNAQPSDVVLGKTFTNSNGEQVGTKDLSNLIASNVRKNVNVGGILGNLNPIISPGNEKVIYTDSFYDYGSWTTPHKFKEAQVNTGGNSGKVRVKASLYSFSPSSTAYLQIYVNDVARGTLRSSMLDSVVTYTEDIDINSGDRISIYIWKSGSANVANDNFQILLYDPVSVVKTL